MGRWEDFVSTVYSRILPLIAFVVVIMGVVGALIQPALLKIEIAGMREALQLMMYVGALTLIVVVLFATYQIALSKDLKDILEEGLPLPKSNPSKEKREEKIETSGAGALAGMVLGGTLGLIFGSAGVIIGGILGALAGNQIEYENIRAERERRKKKT
ncbi:MAG: hypothetical protein AOA65_1047 [Candidatus Bathyarchaeota archaeon BA1]|nr:MAG: hypothetical protein AOA65_1047 [Candidatus Bathyarchaeota archaeon BA1]